MNKNVLVRNECGIAILFRDIPGEYIILRLAAELSFYSHIFIPFCYQRTSIVCHFVHFMIGLNTCA